MENIAVFAYDFPHRKSHDFIVDLLSEGVKNLVVFGAPRKDLGHLRRQQVTRSAPGVFTPLPTRELCQNLQIPYFLVEHGDEPTLSALVSQYGIKLAIISGARILSANVIARFEEGVVNFHPGKIPETSGLDALFYTLKKGVTAGVTTHYIDHRVDAGRLIRFNELAVKATDTLDQIIENTYQLQRVALRELVGDFKTRNISATPIVRPAKNLPMNADEKRETLALFPTWKAKQLCAQIQKRLLAACEQGMVATVADLIKIDSNLIFSTNEKGWTPLIVACFNQRHEVAKLLLSLGADPNRCGANGTTPLMYAKTKLLNQIEQNYAVLELLIEYGADPKRTDGFGKTVLHYVEQADDDRLADFFRRYS